MKFKVLVDKLPDVGVTHWMPRPEEPKEDE